eukprot:1983337-Rhodomonas_salina.2
MSMQQTTEQTWLEWMGPDFETAYKALPLTQQWAFLQQGDHTVKCRRCNGRVEIGIRPLEDIATFLEAIGPGNGQKIQFLAEDSEWPFTTTTDKMSQLEFYYAWEGTSYFR